LGVISLKILPSVKGTMPCKIIIQFGNIAMAPSAVDNIILAIFILKYKLVYGLRTIIKFIDQWFSNMIDERTAGIICNGHADATKLVVVLDIIGAKK
jgi:hypothetical protein